MRKMISLENEITIGRREFDKSFIEGAAVLGIDVNDFYLTIDDCVDLDVEVLDQDENTKL